MNKSIFITGSTGFIGSHILECLLKKNYNITKGVRNKNLAEDEVFCDLANLESIMEIKNKIKADIIIHFGAKVGLENDKLEDLYIPNVLGTMGIVALAKEWNAKLIFASTAIVHGVRCQKIEKNTKINLDNYYANTKWTCEQIIISSKIKYCILRISGVFGNNGPEHLGINKSIKNAINGVSPCLNGKGMGLRNYIYVKDLVSFIIDIIENNYDGLHYVAALQEITIKEMLTQITKVFLSEKKIIVNDGISDHDQLITPSKKVKPKYSFFEALKDIKETSNK